MAALSRVCHFVISFPTYFLSNYFFLSFPRSQERHDNQDNRCSIFPSYLQLVQTPRYYNRNFSCWFRLFRPPFASNSSCPFPEVETESWAKRWLSSHPGFSTRSHGGKPRAFRPVNTWLQRRGRLRNGKRRGCFAQNQSDGTVWNEALASFRLLVYVRAYVLSDHHHRHHNHHHTNIRIYFIYIAVYPKALYRCTPT